LSEKEDEIVREAYDRLVDQYETPTPLDEDYVS